MPSIGANALSDSKRLRIEETPTRWCVVIGPPGGGFIWLVLAFYVYMVYQIAFKFVPEVERDIVKGWRHGVGVAAGLCFVAAFFLAWSAILFLSVAWRVVGKETIVVENGELTVADNIFRRKRVFAPGTVERIYVKEVVRRHRGNIYVSRAMAIQANAREFVLRSREIRDSDLRFLVSRLRDRLSVDPEG